MHNSPQIIAPQPAFLAPTMHFDGSATRLARGAGLTGASDGKQYAISLWVKPNSIGNDVLLSGVTALGGGTYRTLIWFDTDASLNVDTRDSAGGAAVVMKTAASAMVTGKWQHIFISFDAASTGSRHMTIDGVNRLNTVTIYNNVALDHTVADWGIGAHPNGTFYFDGEMAELWFVRGYWATGDYVNWNDNGRPRYIGESGELAQPGTTPILYWSGGTTNRGSGGNFTLTGTLANGVAIG